MNRQDRLAFWAEFINREKIKTITEIGVWRGAFAGYMLAHCPGIEHYTLVDPWERLGDYNKPCNLVDHTAAFEETKSRIAPFENKCTILRKRTLDADLPEVDFTYVDGDHTLRGIIIDLVRAWPCTRWLGGDDFGEIWQHDERYEPTMVFPAAAHFAEAVGARFEVFGDQYLLSRDGAFDYSGDTSLLPHVVPRGGTLLGRLRRALRG